LLSIYAVTSFNITLRLVRSLSGGQIRGLRANVIKLRRRAKIKKKSGLSKR
jgi:hypothetical protein